MIRIVLVFQSSSFELVALGFGLFGLVVFGLLASAAFFAFGFGHFMNWEPAVDLGVARASELVNEVESGVQTLIRGR